jgi:hypothetical protein
MSYLKKRLEENLIKMGGKKVNDTISFIKPNLLIKHIKAGVKYTVQKVYFDDDNRPIVICYRYYKPVKDHQKKVFIAIDDKEFKNYEPV